MLCQEVPGAVSLSFIAQKICAQPASFWLDSSLGHPEYGRYSFWGWDPFLVFESKDGEIKITTGSQSRKLRAHPFELLREFFTYYYLPQNPAPFPFPAGVAGYFAYDLCHHLEVLPRQSRDDLNLPDCWLGFYDRILVYDRALGKLFLTSTGLPEETEKRRSQRARARMGEALALIGTGSPVRAKDKCFGREIPAVTSNFTRETFCEAVAKAREYIFAGDIFQVNLAQRFQAPLTVPPFTLYQRLRKINPVPFAAYLNLPAVVVASASPERFLRLSGRAVETRPIKGTRPRGADPETDRLFREELWQSTKDRAELAMIVDLERNDLGRVCEIGSVQVPRLYALEEYASVFHLVATIVGTLAPGRDFIDCLKATFPGGSITGAPKIRAMEIIDELEPVQRGIYTGSLGYLSFTNTAADLNIVIRTFVIKDNMVYFHAGGGIVADSVPELEYEETLAKAKALIQAVQGGRVAQDRVKEKASLPL